jgi:N4 Gp49/Sf6 Gp66 family protein
MTETSSLQVSDNQAAAVQKTENRVPLSKIEEKIRDVEYINPASVPHFTLAIVRLKNGFIVTGESAPADPNNFNKELGQKFAYENAVRKIWPMEGYLLCEKLTSANDPQPTPDQSQAA